MGNLGRKGRQGKNLILGALNNASVRAEINLTQSADRKMSQ
jgi:hypothetical protein